MVVVFMILDWIFALFDKYNYHVSMQARLINESSRSLHLVIMITRQVSLIRVL